MRLFGNLRMKAMIGAVFFGGQLSLFAELEGHHEAGCWIGFGVLVCALCFVDVVCAGNAK